jgi:hypothetical protein
MWDAHAIKVKKNKKITVATLEWIESLLQFAMLVL